MTEQELAERVTELEELLHNRAKYAHGLRAEIARLREALDGIYDLVVSGVQDRGHKPPRTAVEHKVLYRVRAALEASND